MRDVGIGNGKVVAIQDRINERGAEEIDAQGRLTTPSFINLHVHLDKCLTGERIRTTASKRAGSLDIIPIASQVKRNFTEDDIQRRAVSAVKTALLHGTTMMRAFADVDAIGGLTIRETSAKKHSSLGRREQPSCTFMPETRRPGNLRGTRTSSERYSPE
jgi:cytosine deaminase